MNLRSILTPAFSAFLITVMASLTLNILSTQQIGSNDTLIEISDTPIPTQTTSPTITPSVSTVTTKPSTTPSLAKPTATPKVTARPTAKPCIVTVNGSKYDVTSLRKSHSGGNIFVCGTNMTSTFQSMHGNDYNIIRKYKIS